MFKSVSIADLPEQIVISDQEKQAVPLVWDMPLPPHLDLERLVVNATYLRALHRGGGQ